MTGLVKIAARNLRRNLRRTLITACAIAGGLALMVWTDALSGRLQRTHPQSVSNSPATWSSRQRATRTTPRCIFGARSRWDRRPDPQPRAGCPGHESHRPRTARSTRNTSGVALVGIDPERETTVSKWHLARRGRR